MRYQNLELGLDGLNACMWAYGRNERVDVAWRIYRLLRHNVVPETYLGEGDVNEMASLLGEEYIFVESNIRPNEVTFTMLIQMMAYLGHFESVLNVFHDMLTFLNMEQGAPLLVGGSGELNPSTYQPTVAVYRNVFLGFARHGIPKGRARNSDETGWTLENLSALFDCFLQLRPNSTVTYANVDIIMKAFSVTSEDDLQLMRNVWASVEERFGPIVFKPTSTSRLMRTKMKLFPEQFSGDF
jgi:pentatricopeptide repeat protein